VKRRGAFAPVILGIGAVASGAAFLTVIGALPGMATFNALSFLVGMAAGWGAHRVAHLRHGAAILFGLATAILLLVLVTGTTVDGVTRWLPLGPLNIQPALILSPLLLAIVAGREGRHWRVAILLPILLIALQPDAATMLALVAGAATIAAAASVRSTRGWTPRRIALASGAATIAIVTIVWSGIQTPPAVAFVEGTVELARLSGSAGILLHVVTAVLMVAALLSAGQGGPALAAYFAVAAAAAVFWAFPMPLAGAAPSHAMGFGLAVGCWRRSAGGSFRPPAARPRPGRWQCRPRAVRGRQRSHRRGRTRA
jgi:hypothetical protein